ncbi:hypothetical protein diail_7967 [Diaporthe ilicicola]|nr:hypothetical protein diail_7967 [Diaporthe ilicicola]
MFLGLTTTAFANGTAVPNILPTLSGIYGPPGPEAQKLSRSLVRMYGVRQATMGLVGVTLWWSGEHRLMGVLMLVNTPIAIVDGLVSRWQVGAGEWGHWGFIPVGLALTIGLLRAPLGV